MTSTRQSRRIVQDCFDASYQRMKEEGLDEDYALDLKAATVHWLRHTGISEDVKFRPREHIRDDVGHSSMATGAVAWSASLVTFPFVSLPAYLVLGRNNFEGYVEAFEDSSDKIDQLTEAFKGNLQP